MKILNPAIALFAMAGFNICFIPSPLIHHFTTLPLLFYAAASDCIFLYM
jgi:hypothetical protein